MNPFVVLDLPFDCSDEEVRQRYQTLLRRYPPEADPERFQQINAAYEDLRNARDRWKKLIFPGRPEPAEEEQTPLQLLYQYSQLPGRKRPPGREAFRAMLEAATRASGSKM